MIGVVSMILLVVYNASRPHLSVLGAIPGSPGRLRRRRRHPEYAQVPGLLVLRLEAPLFYANAALVRDRIKTLVGSADPTPRAVILDAGANGDDLDITARGDLTALVLDLAAAGVDFALAEVRHSVRAMARRSGLLEALGEDHVFHTIHEAVDALRPR